MPLYQIAAVALNGIIGRDGRIPWELPEDLQRFKKLTQGTSVVMGRKTYESLPGTLPGRNLFVVSS